MGLADFGISVNGGGPQTGGVDVPGGATIDFVPVSTVGWKRARWEIPDYPEGWATPAGWTLDGSNGTIYSTAVPQPQQILLPDAGALWGVWMPVLLVNEQIDTDQEELEGLYNDENAFCVLSPSGLRDMGAREKEHFTTATTRIKNWLRSYQRNLRAIENPAITLATTTASATRIRRFPVADGTVRSIRAIVNCYNAGGAKHAEYEVKAMYKRVSGTLAQVYAPVITTVFETDAGLNVTLTLNGNTDVDLNVVGLAEAFTWKVSEFFL